MERFAVTIPPWLASVAIALFAVACAIVVHNVAFRLGARWAKRSKTTIDDLAIGRLRTPALWLLITVVLSATQPALSLPANGAELWRQAAAVIVPGLVGWLVAAMFGLGFDVIKLRANIAVEDNLQARRNRTRADILYRIGMFLIFLATFCLMLMSIPAVRAVGVTMIASAGLAALVVGAAAQPALKNLLAGLQMAFTQPIRIDDVVIMDGEWGRVEEIRLTYVVIKIWDERRLVVPVSKFLEDSFQNWTRQTAQIMGSVFWYLDPETDVPRLREKLAEVVRANKRWDGRFFNLQVTDTKPDSIEIRALMTAKDASVAFDLRCDVREAMLAYIRAEMPEAIVRHRGMVDLTGVDLTRPEPALR